MLRPRNVLTLLGEWFSQKHLPADPFSIMSDEAVQSNVCQRCQNSGVAPIGDCYLEALVFCVCPIGERIQLEVSRLTNRTEL